MKSSNAFLANGTRRQASGMSLEGQLPRLEATPPPLRLRWWGPIDLNSLEPSAGEHQKAVFHLNKSQGHQAIGVGLANLARLQSACCDSL